MRASATILSLLCVFLIGSAAAAQKQDGVYVHSQLVTAEQIQTVMQTMGSPPQAATISLTRISVTVPARVLGTSTVAFPVSISSTG